VDCTIQYTALVLYYIVQYSTVVTRVLFFPSMPLPRGTLMSRAIFKSNFCDARRQIASVCSPWITILGSAYEIVDLFRGMICQHERAFQGRTNPLQTKVQGDYTVVLVTRSN
jgi:hypothetical protein